MIGRSLHHFEITAKLGEGGMGEVYRATDSKLGREVAIKVLPPAFTDDPERLARFEREAKVLAAFNHPNVAGIYEVGEAEGVHYLAMELAEGSTLSARLENGALPLPLDEALPIARQIAAALEAAHEKGIVHRDLKPANVMLDRKGGVKVLDFGLAKAWEGGPSAQSNLSLSPTLTAQMTQAGVIMGTAGYMSPEQARGHEADRRSDIWSFGVVLHEMVTGQRLFQAETVSDTLARVLMAEPEWQKIGEALPPPIARLLRRTIERDPRRRLQAIGEARIAIDDYLADPAAATEAMQAAPRAEAAPARRPLGWLAAAVAAGAIAAWAVTSLTGWPVAAPEPLELSYSVGPPLGSVLLTEDVNGIDISRDGTRIVFVASPSGEANQRIYLKTESEAEPRELPGTEGGRGPFFSPDGEWVAYFTDRELRKVAIAGGTPITIASAADRRGGAWHPDGTIYYVPHSSGPILKVSSGGGTPEPVTSLDSQRGERTHRWPSLLPDSSGLLFTSDTQASTEFYDDARIELLDFATGKLTVALEGSSRAVLTPAGRLLFARDGSLYTAPFDRRAGTVSGPPEIALQNVSTVVASGAVAFALARDGSLVYIPGGKTTEIFDLVWMSEDGATEIASDERGRYVQAQLAHRGDRVALVSADQSSQHLWMLDLALGTSSRLTFEATNTDPLWSPDDRWIYFSSNRGGSFPAIFRKRSDGSGTVEQIWQAPRTAYPDSITPDGETLVVELDPPENQPDVGTSLWLVDLTGGSDPRPYIQDTFDASYAAVSPDGRWAAYISTQTGGPQVYVSPFPTGEGRWQVSRIPSREPAWSPDGRRLYYRTLEGLHYTEIEAGDAFRVGRTHRVETGFMGPPFNQTYTVAESQRVLTLRPHLTQDREFRLHVLMGWANHLP